MSLLISDFSCSSLNSGGGAAVLRELAEDPHCAFIARLSRLNSTLRKATCCGTTSLGTQCKRSGEVEPDSSFFCVQHEHQQERHDAGIYAESSASSARVTISGRLYVVKLFGSDHVYQPTQSQLLQFLKTLSRDPSNIHMSVYDHLRNGNAHHDYSATIKEWRLFEKDHTDATISLFLEGVYFCYDKIMERVARTPELLVLDYTFKTNNRDYAVAIPCGADGDSKTITWGLGILSGETSTMTSFVLRFALPFLYGSVLERVRVIMSDEGSTITSVITSVIKEGLYANASHRLCYFHAVNLKFNDMYSKSYTKKDNDTGATVLKWVKHIVWHCESATEIADSMQRLNQWIQQRLEENAIRQIMFDCLEEFIEKVTNSLPKLSLAYVTDPNMTLSCKTSSR